MTNEEYTRKLESIIKQMLQPLKNIPLNVVIEAISDKKVLQFDKNNEIHKSFLSKLKKAALSAGKEINKQGIQRPRLNEVGNDIEIFVKEALGKFGILAETPSTKTKKHKSAGYPDLLLIFENTPFYLECKTFNEDTVSSSQRSFYLSPSEDFKVIYDAPHLVLSYEIYSDYTIGGNLVYKCKTYKILSIEKLLVDVKYEFNSDNNRLYSYNQGTILLAEGIV